MRTLAGWLVCLLCASCAVDQHFEFPQGPQGEQGEQGVPGLSAYEVWLEEIRNNPDYEGGYERVDFFLYLKGEQGEPGDDADLGDITLPEDGKSAYELWVEALEDGEVMKHYLYPDGWPDTMTSEQDFWLFMTGAKGYDGMSAYELWVIDVTDADGLKHPYEDTAWPRNEINEDDFWRYLRGRDGLNGRDGNDGKPGAPGTPGKEIIKQIGRPNVIAAYSDQPNSEFVNENDGTVTYTVYDDRGEIAPLAIVNNMPGMPGKEFTADENGIFTVQPGDLPHKVKIDDRFGSCEVTYLNSENETVTETSAYNTYVPERIDIRLHVTQAPVLTTGNMLHIYVVVERRVEADRTWERIPSYLGSRGQAMWIYEVDDPANPDSFDTSKVWNNHSNNNPTGAYTTWFDVSTSTSMQINRPLKMDSVLGEEYWAFRAWDGEDHYVTLQLKQYYGQSPSAEAVIKLAPIQRTPFIESMMTSEYISTSGGDMVADISGVFDTDYVDYALLFEKTFKGDTLLAPDDVYFTLYEPEPMTQERADAIPVFGVRFTYGDGDGSSSTQNTKYGSLGDPTFAIDKAVYMGSLMTFFSNTSNTIAIPAVTMFYNTMGYAHLRGELNEDKTGLYVLGRNDDAAIPPYYLPTVPVTYVDK